MFCPQDDPEQGRTRLRAVRRPEALRRDARDGLRGVVLPRADALAAATERRQVRG